MAASHPAKSNAHATSGGKIRHSSSLFFRFIFTNPNHVVLVKAALDQEPVTETGMHKSYQPLKPSANKYLQQQWDQTDYVEHRRKVRNAKPTVDTKGIQIPTHIQLKLKKVQAQKERQAIIDRDNRLLATKLAEIQHSKGRIDNWNLYPVHSLNAERRREELLRVTLQNQTIYQRITAQESAYKWKLFEDDWQRADQRRDRMPHYARGVPIKEKLKKSVTFFGEPEQKQNSFSTTTEDTESTDEDIN